MRLLTQVSRFGIKNFYKELGLSRHFTIRGAIRRIQRQHPRMFNVTKFILTFSLVSSITASVIPGTSLPFQYQYKLYFLQKAIKICKFWYLNSNNPDALNYLFTLYRLMQYLMQNGMDSAENLTNFMKEANEVMIGDNNELYKVKNTVRVENICNFVYLLNSMLEKIQISKDASVLADKGFIQQAKTIVDCSVLSIKGQIEQIYKKEFTLSLKIFEYLLKFSQKQKYSQILQKLKILLSDPTKKFVCLALIQQQGLKAQMKRISQIHPQHKDKILQIVQLVQKERTNS